MTGIVLAGGMNTRIGGSKLFLKVGEVCLIDRVFAVLSRITSSMIVVTSEDQLDLVKTLTPKAEVVQDTYPGKGPLGGIYTGLLHSKSEYNLAVGCDMPFLNGALLKHVIDSAPGADAAAPRIGMFIEPLHAVYSRNCLDPMKALILDGERQVIKLFNLVKTRYVDKEDIDAYDPDHLSFFNINTESDLTNAQVLANQRALRGK